MGETVYSRVKLLCKEKGISIAQMERDLGFQRGNAYKWKDVNPSIVAATKLSAYFDKPISYIFKGVDSTEEDVVIDFKTELDRLLNLLKDSPQAVFASNQLSDSSKKILIDSIKHTIDVVGFCQNA